VKAQHRADVHQRAAVARLEGRQHGVAQAGQRRDVDVEHLLHLRGRGLRHGRQRRGAGVVHQQGDGRVGGHRLRHALQVGGGAQVGHQRLHLHAVLGAQRLRHFIEPVAAARHQQQVVAAPGQAVRVDLAQAGRGAGDDGGAEGCLFAHFDSIQWLWSVGHWYWLKHDGHHVWRIEA
jgi:hypothetical protein